MPTDSGQDRFNVKDSGAVGDGIHLDSPAIQKAVDACYERGGGLVHIPPGIYLCGTIHLRNNVSLNIAAGACLQYSPKEEDFDEPEELPYNPHADIETTYFRFALIHAENVTSVSIRGGGRIDGKPFRRAGPKPIALKSCKDVEIRGITIDNAPNYCISLLDCEEVVIDGVKIHNGLADGIDLDNCRVVTITNSHIECYDDGVCLKTSPALGKLGKTTDVTVTNCCISTSCYALKIGTETSGDSRNVAFSNCTLSPQPGRTSFLGGIALEAVDGARVDNYVITNITMHGARCPVFLRVGNRGRAQLAPVPGHLEDVVLSNITAKDATLPCIVAGIPDKHVAHVTISNVIVEYGKAKPEASKKKDLNVPECIADYPEPMMFGSLPAWGIYCRHASHIDFKHAYIRQAVHDPRAAIVLDDTRQISFDGRISWMDPVEDCVSVWINESQHVAVHLFDPSDRPFYNFPGLTTKQIQHDRNGE
jgi:polygalacturonase